MLLVKHEYELRCSAINAMQKKRWGLNSPLTITSQARNPLCHNAPQWHKHSWRCEEHNLTSYDIGQKGNLWCFLSTFFNKGPTHLWNKLQSYIWYPISNVTYFSPHTAEVSLAGTWVITCYLYILVQHTSKQSSVGWSSHLNCVKNWTARWIKVTSTRTLAHTGMKHHQQQQQQQQQQQHNRISFRSWKSVNNLSITCTYSSLDFHKGRCKRW